MKSTRTYERHDPRTPYVNSQRQASNRSILAAMLAKAGGSRIAAAANIFPAAIQAAMMSIFAATPTPTPPRLPWTRPRKPPTNGVREVTRRFRQIMQDRLRIANGAIGDGEWL